jgi:hypothetical protein
MAGLPSRSPLVRTLNPARLRYATARQPSPSAALRAKAGGAEGSRTPDLLIANETLYQLSYDPIQFTVNDLQSN